MTTGFTSNKFKTRPLEPLYFAMEDADLTFTRAEVAKTVMSWRNGDDLRDIAKKIDHTHEETAVLIMDLALKGKIEPRDCAIWR